MWALAADRVRGIKHTRRDNAKMELILEHDRRWLEWQREPLSGYAIAVLLLDRIEELRLTGGFTKQAPDHGLKQDQHRAILETMAREIAVEKIRIDRLGETRINAYFAVMSQIHGLAGAIWNIKVRNQTTPTGP